MALAASASSAPQASAVRLRKSSQQAPPAQPARGTLLKEYSVRSRMYDLVAGNLQSELDVCLKIACAAGAARVRCGIQLKYRVCSVSDAPIMALRALRDRQKPINGQKVFQIGLINGVNMAPFSFTSKPHDSLHIPKPRAPPTTVEAGSSCRCVIQREQAAVQALSQHQPQPQPQPRPQPRPQSQLQPTGHSAVPFVRQLS